MINVTKLKGKPGSWINPNDNPTPSSNETYAVNKTVNGYVTAADAKQRKNKKATVQPGHYAIFNKSNGMINVTKLKGKPGSWINPNDNK